MEQIKYLCSRISKVEWSGILFYTVKGDIEKENLDMVAEFIYPMSKDSSAYTSFNYDENVMKFMMGNPETMGMRQGLIHSHNSMGSFFSQTDMSELCDNAKNHQFYLSLIVNNAMDFVARVGILVEKEVVLTGTRKFRGASGMVNKPFNISKTEKILEYYNCDIFTYDLEVDKWFTDRVSQIIKEAEPKNKFVFPKNSKFFEQTLSLEPFNQSTSIKFIAKYIAGDLDYDGTVYKALEELDKSEQTVQELTGIMAEGFDLFYDDYFEHDGNQLEILSKLGESVSTWTHKFPRASEIITNIINELTIGYYDNTQ